MTVRRVEIPYSYIHKMLQVKLAVEGIDLTKPYNAHSMWKGEELTIVYEQTSDDLTEGKSSQSLETKKVETGDVCARPSYLTPKVQGMEDLL